jgi:hypothetical protein
MRLLRCWVPHRPAHQAHAQHINNSNLNVKKNNLVKERIMTKEKKQWEVPEIITYSEDEILKAIGPASCAISGNCSPSP